MLQNPSQKSKNKHKALDLKKHRKYLLLSVILVSSKFNHSGWKSLEKVSFCKNAKIHSGWNYNYKKSLILIIELCAKNMKNETFFRISATVVKNLLKCLILQDCQNLKFTVVEIIRKVLFWYLNFAQKTWNMRLFLEFHPLCILKFNFNAIKFV